MVIADPAAGAGAVSGSGMAGGEDGPEPCVQGGARSLPAFNGFAVDCWPTLASTVTGAFGMLQLMQAAINQRPCAS
jgi:hypothetical protein